MSFIAITYGYNQFSIFNTNTPTQPLIDNIISTCINDIIGSIDNRIHTLSNVLKQIEVDIGILKTSLSKVEFEKQKEEEKIQLEQKQINETTAKKVQNTKGLFYKIS